jgi:GT2 family glycosyltransferase
VILEAGAPGWCGLAGDGRLTVRPLSPDRPLSLRLDGKPFARTRRVPWLQANSLSVTTEDGAHLLGSPIDLHAIARTEGIVSCLDGGIEGWAWHPGDPDANPVLTIRSLDGRHEIRVRATEDATTSGPMGLMARPRGFRISAERLAKLGMIHVLGRDGIDLLGSPLDPAAEQQNAAAAATSLARLYPPSPIRGRVPRLAPPPAIPAETALHRSRRTPNRKRVAVVIPVHDGKHTSACLDSVLATVASPNRIVVVDDGSRNPDIVRALDQLARQRRIQLIRNQRNQGFVASANVGLASTRGNDVVLLNSDTLVPPGWIEHLAAAAYTSPDIGTVTPLSNNATIVSYPGAAHDNDVPDLNATLRLAALAKRANGRTTIDIPVAIGFCMFIRHDCLNEVGLLRADVFAQGYGEENDFCLRARHLGWRHVAAPGTYVAHVGAGSFGTAARHLQARNQALLERLHPGYDNLIEAHLAADPLADARRKLDTLRWRAARPRNARSTILITHESGGGVERQIRASIARHDSEGRRAIVLRPAELRGRKAVLIADGTYNLYPNLRYVLPDELPALRRLLAADEPAALELHHLVGHHPSLLELIPLFGVPYDVYVHDYGWLCGRIALVSRDERYCGEPEVARCEACIADAGSLLDEEISVAALRQRSAKLLSAARQVVVPSQDTAARIRRYFSAARIAVVPHEDDASITNPAAPRSIGGRSRVCVIGAIGVHKGYQVLLDCARDAAERRLPLDFIVVGHTIDDNRLLATGRVFVTGEFAADEATALIKAQQATLAWLPSIWPETWLYALTDAWRAGLRAVAFDIGAQAERIRRTGRGILLPLGLPPAGINAALLTASGLSR